MDKRVIGAGVALSIIALVTAAFLLWPAPEPEVAASPPPRKQSAPVRLQLDAPPPGMVPRPGVISPEQAEAEVLEIEQDPGSPQMTVTCRDVLVDVKRNVPDFVLIDNLEARGERFDDADLACITAGGAPNAILEYAEHHPQKR